MKEERLQTRHVIQTINSVAIRHDMLKTEINLDIGFSSGTDVSHCACCSGNNTLKATGYTSPGMLGLWVTFTVYNVQYYYIIRWVMIFDNRMLSECDSSLALRN